MASQPERRPSRSERAVGGPGGTYKLGGVVVRCIPCDGLIIRVGKDRLLRIVDLPAGRHGADKHP